MDHYLSLLKFPLFETSELEKKLLRKAELYLIDHERGPSSLCVVLSRLSIDPELVPYPWQWELLVVGLKGKIGASLEPYLYLEAALYFNNGLSIDCPIFNSPKLLRRYWITLLLNYKPQERKHD